MKSLAGKICISKHCEQDSSSEERSGCETPLLPIPRCRKRAGTSWLDGVITTLLPRVKKNCSKLLQGDTAEVRHVSDVLKSWRINTTLVQLLRDKKNCARMRRDFSGTFYVSSEEQSFPIAYILIVYTNPLQIVRFLKTIYRPHNLYCIHPDPSSGGHFADIFHSISKCLDNVFVASHLAEVYYGHRSILEAQINCYKHLLRYPEQRWHYTINLCGRELPLKTNRDIVNILQRANGSSIIRPVKIDTMTKQLRFTTKRGLKESKVSKKSVPSHTNIILPPVPHDLQLYKSLTYNALSRNFITFLFTNQTSLDLLEWIRDAGKPEEHFYATMYMVPSAPHGHEPPLTNNFNVINCFWVNTHDTASLKSCSGKVVHDLCIASSGDLHKVYMTSIRPGTYMFFNKYFMDEDHIVMDCMEERLVERNRAEYRLDCGWSELAAVNGVSPQSLGYHSD